MKSTKISHIFIAHKENIASGDFSFGDTLNLSENEKRQLSEIKTAYALLGSNLVLDCIYSHQKTITLSRCFATFVLKFVKLRKLQKICAQIPNFRKNNIAKNYIDAFSYDETIRRNLLECYSSPEAKLGSILNSIDVYDKTKIMIAENFLNWCNFDLQQEISQIFKKIYAKPRIKKIIECRANGMTLEEIGQLLGVTRERIRQIEVKVKEKFKYQLRIIKPMSKIYADLNGASVITLSQIETASGSNANAFVYLLRKTDASSYCYDMRLDTFVFGDNDLSSIIQNFIDSLPNVIHIGKVEKILKDVKIEYGIDSEHTKKILYDTYKTSGDVLHRSRLSLAKIYDAVLRKYFSDGIHIYSDENISKMREYIYKDFGDIHLPDNNRAVVARVPAIGILAGRGIYKPKKTSYISKDLQQRIFSYIMESDAPVLLIKNIFAVFQSELIKEGVDNSYYLQGVLHELFNDKLYFKRDYISKNKEFISIYSLIISFIKESKNPVTKEELKDKFKGITDIILAFAISDNDILNYFGRYMHSSNIVIQENEKNYLATKLKNLLSDNKAHHIKEIYRIVTNDIPECFTRNGILWHYGAFSLLKYLFREQFQFLRPYIALNNVDMSYFDEKKDEMFYTLGNKSLNNGFNTKTLPIQIDDMENIDELLEDVITDELLEEGYEF